MLKILYYYEFTDGYFCFTAGKMSKSDILREESEHGKLYFKREIKGKGTYYASNGKLIF